MCVTMNHDGTIIYVFLAAKIVIKIDLNQQHIGLFVTITCQKFDCHLTVYHV